jgi:hypothetical protein
VELFNLITFFCEDINTQYTRTIVKTFPLGVNVFTLVTSDIYVYRETIRGFTD